MILRSFLLLISTGRIQAQDPTDDRPNIIFVITDDLGWSDVSWNNLQTNSTPFMADLIHSGQASSLRNSYATHRCSPSRAQFLTGRYAFRYGLGSDPISFENPIGMSTKEKLLPQYLKEIGYNTHAVGKWHLGYCNSSFQPHNRGFDTFLGHYGGGVDYHTHATQGSLGSYLNHFLNGEPHIPEDGFEFASYAWSNRTRKVLRENTDKPNFVYLAFNAPHEKVAATQELIDEAKEMYPDIPGTRRLQLAAVKSIDVAMQSVIEEARTLERETIIVFHTDNGGALLAYAGGFDGPRGCSYPYKGYKSVLAEGGTLSPTWVYSTKRQFHSRYIDGLIHIMDFFPTILRWAGYNKPMPRDLDGIDQYDLFENEAVTQIRDKFIYGLLHEWDDDNLAWETTYAVRYGDYKFMNYQSELIGNTQCSEGWLNSRHAKYLFPFKKTRDARMKKVFAISDAEPNKETGETLRNPGFSLYNLKKDPFETRNMGTGGSEKKFTKAYMDLINNIQSYVAEEIQKGIEYPITGKFKGKLVSRIMKKLPAATKTQHYFDTGRLQLFDGETQNATGFDGYVGSNWCPNNLDEQIFIEMYNDAVATGKESLAYMINLYLWDGYGPEGTTRASQPSSGILSGRRNKPGSWFWDDEDNFESDWWFTDEDE